MKKLFALILIIFSTLILSSQKSRVKFEKLSVEKGLSQSSVLSIAQDSQGFMWFATLDGLNKYDGYTIKVYWNKPQDNLSISDNIINVLYETNDKTDPTLWIGTAANGICKYDKLKDNFISFKNAPNKPSSISNNNINDITGNNRTLWIATNGGLNRFDQKKRIFYKYRHKQNDNSISSDTVNCIVKDKAGNIWAGTKNGLDKINTKTYEVKRIANFPKSSEIEINDLLLGADNILWIGSSEGLYSCNLNTGTVKYHHLISAAKIKNQDKYNITSIIEDKDNSLWIGTESNGLINYYTKTNYTKIYKNDPMNKFSISTNSILSIYRDRSDILWVGTSLGGVNKWNRAAEELRVFRHNPYDEHSLSAPQVRTFYVDKKGDIWVGTVEGGLNKWDKKTGKFFHYKHTGKIKSSISNNHVRSIYEDTKGNFWVATDGGGLNLFDRISGNFIHFKHNESENSISHNRVWKILEDDKGNLWIGTFGGGLNLFDTEKKVFIVFKYDANNINSISNNQITSIIQDSEKNLWIGTFGGLNKFNPDENKFIRYTYKGYNKNSISNNRIYCIYEDNDGIIWIGTKGGLNRFDPKTNMFKHFTRDNSDLPNNVILGITEERDYLWMSTNNGLSRMNKKTGKIKNFDTGDGLQNNEFLAGSFLKKNDDEILFGGIDGFNAFYPKNLVDNPHKPPIVITGFQISNRYIKTDTATEYKKQIILNHTQNDISFDFVALDFIFPEKNQYKYKLEGYDNKWNNSNFRRFAKYTNLIPGNYIFRVKGSNNDDVWNEEGTSISVIIEPAFWQTLWFKITVVSFILFLIFSIYHIRIRTVKRRNEELEKEVKKRTYEIRQQNEEIKTQRDELAVQKDKIAEQNEDITDSIHYAKKIQTAALPTNEFILENIPEHFILFKPRDIVSGDFYWFGKKNNKIIVTAVDCTGHGVPGAFMSMLGISFLNEIVNEKNITDSGEILNRLRKNIIDALHPKGYETESKDGMDMSLCVIDIRKNTLEFSGAFNPLFHLHSGKITEIKADRMPVAKYDMMKPFSVKKIKIENGDSIYMFSDGYPDQFGGPENKKFMKKRLKLLLEENQNKPMQELKKIMDHTIEEWKGNEPQIDDIVVIGIQL